MLDSIIDRYHVVIDEIDQQFLRSGAALLLKLKDHVTVELFVNDWGSEWFLVTEEIERIALCQDQFTQRFECMRYKDYNK